MFRFKVNNLALVFISIVWITTAIITFAYILPKAQNERAKREIYVSNIKSFQKELDQEIKKWEKEKGMVFEASRSSLPLFREIAQKKETVLELISQEKEQVDQWDLKLQKTSNIGFLGTTILLTESLLATLLIKSSRSKED